MDQNSSDIKILINKDYLHLHQIITALKYWAKINTARLDIEIRNEIEGECS